MIKKLFLITLIFGVYVAVIATDTGGMLFIKTEKYYQYWSHKMKKMNIEIHVNKWVYNDK